MLRRRRARPPQPPRQVVVSSVSLLPRSALASRDDVHFPEASRRARATDVPNWEIVCRSGTVVSHCSESRCGSGTWRLSKDVKVRHVKKALPVGLFSASTSDGRTRPDGGEASAGVLWQEAG